VQVVRYSLDYSLNNRVKQELDYENALARMRTALGVRLNQVSINGRKFQLLILAGAAVISGTADPGVTGFCQRHQNLRRGSIPCRLSLRIIMLGRHARSV